MRDHTLIIALLSAIRADLADSLREAAVGTDRKYDLGRAWDNLQDAQAILQDVDLIECQR
jgi:predicted transcriptional regulator